MPSPGKTILIAISTLFLAAVGLGAWMLRPQVEEIPTQLEPIDRQTADPMNIRIAGIGGMPDLVLADLQGFTVFLILNDRESYKQKESKSIELHLSQWILPEHVRGFAIGDAEGFSLLRSKIDAIVEKMQKEVWLPTYIDYEGITYRTFKLPRGHSGFVVLDPKGEVLFRHSGPMNADVQEQLRELLHAHLPSKPVAPEFSIGDLDHTKCQQKYCLLVFLSQSVERAQVPGLKDGFQGSPEEMMKQLENTDIRLIASLAKADKSVDSEQVQGIIVGDTKDIDFEKWLQVEDDEQVRSLFAIPQQTSGLILIDQTGKIVLREIEQVPFYKLEVISEAIGVPLYEQKH